MSSFLYTYLENSAFPRLVKVFGFLVWLFHCSEAQKNTVRKPGSSNYTIYYHQGPAVVIILSKGCKSKKWQCSFHVKLESSSLQCWPQLQVFNFCNIQGNIQAALMTRTWRFWHFAVQFCFRCKFSFARVKFDSGAIFLDQSQFFASHNNQWDCFILYKQ